MQFDWDEENRLLKTTEGISATDPDKVTQYKYDDAGKRIIKKSDASEVVYVNDNFTVRNSDAISKHIFAGNTRVATVIKTASASDDIFYYHSDHLGSSNVVTNKQGGFNERIEYLPYGETWVQEKAADATNMMPYRFTSKEQDQETGLYYFGARYYDSKLSRWISTDPAVEKYLPEAGKGSDGLPGLGGIFNPVNMNVYQYGGNNPVMFVDPDGRVIYVNGYILPYVSAGDQYGCDYAMGNGGQVARVAVSRGLLIGHGGVDSFPAVTDVTARGNFKIVSTADGWIKRKGYDSTFGGGNFVEISHGKDLKGNEISTRYFHLSSIDSNIKEGALVRKDQSIGYLGNTDNSEWHSHYEIQINGKSIDPRFLNIQGLLFNQNNYFNNYYNFYNNSTYMDYIFGGSNNGGGGFNFYFGGIRNF
jgi:RHS repeat-associated protein